MQESRLLLVMFQGMLPGLLSKYGFDLCLKVGKRHIPYTHNVPTVRPVGLCPAAIVCRQPRDLCSSACGRRWPVAWRSVTQSSHQVWPKITRTSGSTVVCLFAKIRGSFICVRCAPGIPAAGNNLTAIGKSSFYNVHFETSMKRASSETQ